MKNDISGRRGRTEGVQIALAVTAEEHRLGWKILDAKTKGIKFHRNRIITSKRSNGYKIVDESRGNKHIV